MANTKRRNGFSRQFGAVYVCETCSRKTRHNGSQSMGSKLCAQCFELAGLSNEISDGHQTKAELHPQIDRLLAEIRSKGGNPDESFPEFVEVENV